MITLKTLPEATAQEVFDQIARHLLTQMKRSTNDDSCKYRSYKGLKCAAGCLIADDEYLPEMDAGYGSQWQSLVNSGYVSGNCSRVINRLQAIHDNYEPSSWMERLFSFANDYKLNTAVLNEFGNEYE